ncbi:hypothetical protein Taro_005898, partial [Colocasia esculenta]|nr:hypothetical protein [Colocasia esculenta]
VAVVRPGATGEPAGLARFENWNAAVRPVAFMTRRGSLPRHSCYRGASRRRDNRGGPTLLDTGSRWCGLARQANRPTWLGSGIGTRR